MGETKAPDGLKLPLAADEGTGEVTDADGFTVAEVWAGDYLRVIVRAVNRGPAFDAMLAELRRLEWSDTTSFPGDPSPCCPSCYWGRDKGHAPGCTHAAAIRMATGDA
jgi:hypothetical protein